jgi:hypothetical protein
VASASPPSSSLGSPVSQASAGGGSGEAHAALLAAARRRLPSARGEEARRLAELIEALSVAVAAGDAERAALVDVELTDLLFEMD